MPVKGRHWACSVTAFAQIGPLCAVGLMPWSRDISPGIEANLSARRLTSCQHDDIVNGFCFAEYNGIMPLLVEYNRMSMTDLPPAASSDPCDISKAQRVKVAYLVPPSPHFAGMERVTHDIASELSQGFSHIIDVTVIYFNYYAEVQNATYDIVRANGNRVRHVPAALHQIIADKRFDVIVIPQFENAVLSLMYNRLCGRHDKIVLHLHGNPDIERSTSLKSRVLFSLYHRAATWFAGIVAVSPGLVRSVVAELGGRGDVRYLPNPVRQLTSRSAVDHGERAQHFVSVGRLAYQKGHDLAIRAFRQVVDEFPQATFAILGAGPEEAALLALVHQLGLETNVFLTGAVSDPAPELAQASAFISAARWEGFGVAIVEALSAGLPVIATRCDFGPEDIITAPELGVLVPAEDVDALASAMIQHLRAPGIGMPQDRIKHAARFAKSAVATEHAEYLLRFGTRVMP